MKFSLATLVLAGVWTVGAFASGPLHLGRVGRPSEPDLIAPRPVVQPLLIGALLAIVFVFGAFVVREFPWLDEQVSKVLAHTGQGSAVVLLVVTVVNGIAEELFFRERCTPRSRAARSSGPPSPTRWPRSPPAT